jgi:hypothetical protein
VTPVTDAAPGMPDCWRSEQKGGSIHYTSFRITDTQDGRYAVEDERGFVLEGAHQDPSQKVEGLLAQAGG